MSEEAVLCAMMIGGASADAIGDGPVRQQLIIDKKQLCCCQLAAQSVVMVAQLCFESIHKAETLCDRKASLYLAVSEAEQAVLGCLAAAAWPCCLQGLSP